MPDYTHINPGQRPHIAPDTVSGAMFVALLCGIVFAFHPLFNDSYVRPKYYFLAAGIALFALLSLLRRRGEAGKAAIYTDTVTLSFSALCLWMFVRGTASGVAFDTMLPLSVLAAYLLMRHFRANRFIDGTIIAACIMESAWVIADGMGTKIGYNTMSFFNTSNQNHLKNKLLYSIY